MSFQQRRTAQIAISQYETDLQMGILKHKVLSHANIYANTCNKHGKQYIAKTIEQWIADNK